MRFILFPESCEMLKFPLRAGIDDFSVARVSGYENDFGFPDVVSVSVWRGQGGEKGKGVVPLYYVFSSTMPSPWLPISMDTCFREAFSQHRVVQNVC